ncbi:MAG TPA: hypothetical protein VH968_08945 [Gaiellaceae bacterium]|jgi:hypothetical protein
MLKKVLIVSGAVLALAGAGAVVWVASDSGTEARRVAALSEVEPLAEGVRGMLRWRGAFDCGAEYEPLDVVVVKGSSYIAREAVRECASPPERPWDLLAAAGERGAQGAQGQQGDAGPAGSFGGSYQSPDGRFTLSVTNTGIKLSGPNTTSVHVTQSGVEVKGGTKVTVDAGATATVRGGITSVNGAIVSLGGTSCQPVARQNDQVTGVAAPGLLQNGRVSTGSQKVLAC